MNRVGDSLFHFGANEELIAALIAEHVEFVLIGGIAVSWYCADRQADDLDVLVNPTADNATRVVKALEGLGLHGVPATSLARAGVQVPIKSRFYAEILTPSAEGPCFSDVGERAVLGKIFGFPVRIAAVSTLIEMKKLAVVSTESSLRKHRDDLERLSKYASDVGS